MNTTSIFNEWVDHIGSYIWHYSISSSSLDAGHSAHWEIFGKYHKGNILLRIPGKIILEARIFYRNLIIVLSFNIIINAELFMLEHVCGITERRDPMINDCIDGLVHKIALTPVR